LHQGSFIPVTRDRYKKLSQKPKQHPAFAKSLLNYQSYVDGGWLWID